MHQKRPRLEAGTEAAAVVEAAVAVTAPEVAAWVAAWVLAWVDPSAEPGAVRVALEDLVGVTSRAVVNKATATGLPPEPVKTEVREALVALAGVTSRAVVNKATATGLHLEPVKTPRVDSEDSEAASSVVTETETALEAATVTRVRVTSAKAIDSPMDRALSLEEKASTEISAEKEAPETVVSIAMSILLQLNMEKAITGTPKVTDRQLEAVNTTAAKMSLPKRAKVTTKAWTPTDKMPAAENSIAAKMSLLKRAKA